VASAPMLALMTLDTSRIRVTLSTVPGSEERIIQSGTPFVQEVTGHSNDAERHATAASLIWTLLAFVTTPKPAPSSSLASVSESVHGLRSQLRLASPNFSAHQIIQFFTFARRHAENVSILVSTTCRFRLHTMVSTEIACGCRQDQPYGLTHAPTQRYETPVARLAILVHRTWLCYCTSFLFACSRHCTGDIIRLTRSS
jgi:hypothetical protein